MGGTLDPDSEPFPANEEKVFRTEEVLRATRRWDFTHDLLDDSCTQSLS